MSNKVVAGMTAFVVILGGATAYGVYADANSRAQDAVKHMAEKYNLTSDSDVTVTYGDVKANFLDQTATVNDLAFNVKDHGTTVKIASATFSSKGYVENKEFPTSVDIHIDGLEIPHDGLKTALNERMSADYFDHVIHGSFGYRFDKENDVLKTYGNVVVEDINNMSFKTTISNARGLWSTVEANYAKNEGKLDFEREERRTIRSMKPKIRVNDVTFNYTNDGEIEYVLEKFAVSKGATLAELQMKIPEAIDEFLGDAPFAADVGVFLVNPKTLSVSFTPKTPMTPQELTERFQMLTTGSADQAIEGADFKLVVNKDSE